MASFLEASLASRTNLVYLVKGTEKASDADAWYYVHIENKLKEPIFLKNIKTGLRLTDYGRIIYSGWGKEPPQYIIDAVLSQYGA